MDSLCPGTTAHVGIKLYGDLSKSEARHLTKNDVFQRNSHDTFLIATDNELGNLHKVRSCNLLIVVVAAA